MEQRALAAGRRCDPSSTGRRRACRRGRGPLRLDGVARLPCGVAARAPRGSSGLIRRCGRGKELRGAAKMRLGATRQRPRRTARQITCRRPTPSSARAGTSAERQTTFASKTDVRRLLLVAGGGRTEQPPAQQCAVVGLATSSSRRRGAVRRQEQAILQAVAGPSSTPTRLRCAEKTADGLRDAPGGGTTDAIELRVQLRGLRAAARI